MAASRARLLCPFHPCLVLLACGVACAHPEASATSGALAPTASLLAEPLRAPSTLQVTSSSFADGQALAAASAFNGFGCTGKNVSPDLHWSGAPAGTKSFAVIMHDPDAPTGVGFFHWSVVNLPASVTTLAAGGSPLPAAAVQGYTDFGTTGYGGPCPPPGAPHRYAFTVYALDVDKLPVDGHATGALLRFMLREHTLAYGRLIGTFQRPAT